MDAVARLVWVAGDSGFVVRENVARPEISSELIEKLVDGTRINRADRQAGALTAAAQARIAPLLDELCALVATVDVLETFHFLRSIGVYDALLAVTASGADDALVDAASQALAAFGGPMSRGPVLRRWEAGGIGVTLRHPSFAEADLGYTTWSCSKVLTAWLVQERGVVAGKDVLELGCGTALPGIVCALMGEQAPRRVTLTDYHPAVVANARTNVGMNPAPIPVNVAQLDWRDCVRAVAAGDAHARNESGDQVELAAYDLVLAADVVYDESVWRESLAPCIISLLKRGVTTQAIIVVQDTHDRFKGFAEVMTELGCALVSQQPVTYWSDAADLADEGDECRHVMMRFQREPQQ